MYKLSWTFRDILIFLPYAILVDRVGTDFILTGTEEEIKCLSYTGNLACNLECSGYCSSIGFKYKSCLNQNTVATECCCVRNVKIKSNTCRNRCRKKAYDYTYDTTSEVCKCYCSESICSDYCSQTEKLGKCNNTKMELPLEDLCPCYCDETCVSKFSTKFVNSYCKKDQCIRTCNGTENTGPPWCKLYENKCGCNCESKRCEMFCKGKSDYGICQTSDSCNCQFSRLTDKECRKYCLQRTDSVPAKIPSKTGHCKCNYFRNIRCATNCITSKSCSPLDGCFCKDTTDSLREEHTGMQTCQGKLCYVAFAGYSLDRDSLVATNKLKNNSIGVICLGLFFQDYNVVPGVTLAEKTEDGELEVEQSKCLIAYQNVYKEFKIVTKPILFIVQGNQSNFKFKTMNKNGKIPKEAVKFRHRYYFGRAFGGKVIGTINGSGIMSGGDVTLQNWEMQTLIYPDTFEIFVCISNSSFSKMVL